MGGWKLKPVIRLSLCVILVASLGATSVKAEHHVVGEDRGWDPSSDVASWAADRIFRVGDNIWFAYSAAQESIAELRSKEEYESCDVGNPIRMYTDGLDKIPLDKEGVRYFTSSRTESCKGGLKLHVDVLPEQNQEDPKVRRSGGVAVASVVAAGPTTPSPSNKLSGFTMLLLVGFGFCNMWLSHY